MLRSSRLTASLSKCRAYSGLTGTLKVPVLSSGSVETFQRDAFQPAVPAMLPSKHFAALPAIERWFLISPERDTITLNTSYLAKFGATIVPLEISNHDGFSRIEQSLSFFLDASTMTAPTAQIYLAQAPLMDLPRSLVNDVPTPDIVWRAGKGDLYDSSIWLGQAPTYTPLHRDPNPNLFVQLAGKKVVRLYKPNDGLAIFAEVQEKIGGTANATMRGEEMMHGAEKKALEQEVWAPNELSDTLCWEAELLSGDGLFIPKGWWHSIKGVGEGMTGSVNWWFR